MPTVEHMPTHAAKRFAAQAMPEGNYGNEVFLLTHFK